MHNACSWFCFLVWLYRSLCTLRLLMLGPLLSQVLQRILWLRQLIPLKNLNIRNRWTKLLPLQSTSIHLHYTCTLYYENCVAIMKSCCVINFLSFVQVLSEEGCYFREEKDPKEYFWVHQEHHTAITEMEVTWSDWWEILHCSSEPSENCLKVWRHCIACSEFGIWACNITALGASHLELLSLSPFPKPSQPQVSSLSCGEL